MHLTSEDIQLLTQIGYLAAGCGDVARTERIFNTLVRERNQSAFALLGVPIALLNAGNTPAAVQRLQSIVLPPSSDADLVQAFFGMALQMDARPAQAQKVLWPLAKNSSQAHAKRLATLLLQQTLASEPVTGHMRPFGHTNQHLR